MTAAITDGLSWGTYLIALVGVAVILGFVDRVARTAGSQHGAWGLVLGFDGRTSTSKLSAALWTLALLYAFAVLLVGGRASEVGALSEEYLLLLGGPYAAAIGAKASTSRKAHDGRSSKKPSSERGASRRVAEIVSDDSGEVDLGDFQYFAFTLLTIGYFFVGFVQDPNGLPDLPDTLVGLSTVSAAAYLTKKVAINEPGEVFTISSVRPSRIVLGETTQIHIAGSGFPGGSESENRSRGVMLNGVKLEDHDWTATSVKADLVDWAGGGLEENQQSELVVLNGAGTPSQPFLVSVQEKR